MTQTTNELCNRSSADICLIGFDTETTGKYPLGAEICEIAAVKWMNGQMVDRFQTLIQPSTPMHPEVIAIHGITNEMVANAPKISEIIEDFYRFIQDGILIAHHAPFDLGFLSIEFEKSNLPLPQLPVICSSLLSRKLFPDSSNHRLQTLIKYFNLNQGTAHRALDDAQACLEVGLRCLNRLGGEVLSSAILQKAFEAQGGELSWHRFSLAAISSQPTVTQIVSAINTKSEINMRYEAGSHPGHFRRVRPEGIVRSLDGDYIVAYAEADRKSKRYLLEKISSAERISEKK